ncbi:MULTISPECIES: MerR family transcriptional regulator [Bacillus]|uniref:MerR family transcriptional regulator n=1 Tax=Bacillus TaxID=1386 RepID=UPI001581FEBB|nr:MerR family transcriptional regulator [Bacillus glycinifermentans]MBU8785894.1 TipAS antibiotic-recognition domain-containing protein [Bacillus glycinifermentans]NUJ15570.1 MerR family transcriptional regulator [Bacillus glycinifermentans]
MKLKVKEVADMVGISVRTLHHYDEIGLLIPSETTESGYRLYSDDDLEKLQQILFFRELDFPLKRIKTILEDPSFDRHEALHMHRKMLLEKRKRLDQMIETIDKTIQFTKGEIEMTNEEKFAGFDFSQNPYEAEARERWGDEAIDKTKAHMAAMSEDERKAVERQFDAIYRKIACLRNGAPDAEEAQEAIQEWYDFLNQNSGHHFSLETFKCIGQMYVDDERFTKNIDQYGEGLAEFMRDAMAVFAERNKKSE